jgi:hypothetical protein
MPPPGNTVHQEYIPEADINWYVSVSSDVSKAIQAVRGTVYTTKQSIGLYPTSATSDDYAYSPILRESGYGKRARFHSGNRESLSAAVL